METRTVRQPIREAQGHARTHTDDAIAMLAKMMHDPKAPAAARVAAASALLDRGWGQPTQPAEITGADGAALFPSLAVTIARMTADDDAADDESGSRPH